MDPPPPPKPTGPPAAPPAPADFAARAAATFNSALELAPTERAVFIAERCGDDGDLQQQVARLLAAHEKAGDFLDQQAISPELEEQFARLKPEEPGDRIGPYKLLQQIGEGGFGVVWMAEQEQPVRRRVALKIIKLGMDTREVIARFEQERQALAMMEHPNIAKVFDAGATQFGRPFFVMELVRGIKITDYCDQANLSTAKRLELFILVCQAVQHAHQKGIIHRDLKPSNILVTLHDGVPVPKVIDFGVAKATQQQRLTDLTLFTQFEQMIGTPLYMSPEQAEMSGLDIDTRSDIYSLGVLLYELLTGRTPFDPEELMRKGYDEIRRAIREQEPQKPSTFLTTMALEVRTGVALHRQAEVGKLANLIRGDLDWIVMKALEKDRSRRYETANGFALDIQRHLNNEPVVARPTSALYQFRRFVKRNKGAFAAGTAIALAVLIGLATSVWQAVRANAALNDLRASAPAFIAQARGLVAKEQFGEAIEKLDYAIKLRPDNADYLLARADLLECQLDFAGAAAAYRKALQLDPQQTRAATNAALCERLASEQTAEGKLSRESLLQLLVTMAGEHRSAAEMLPVGRLVSDEKKLLVDAWLERLKDLPIPPKTPLAERLTMGNDGLLELDLSNTSITDLSPLKGMPLGFLDLSLCLGVADLGPLRGLPLKILYLKQTKVTDLTPLAEVKGLKNLNLTLTGVRDLAPLRDLRLEQLDLTNTFVADIELLHGMPLRRLSLRNTLVSDVTPLKGLQLISLDCTAIPAVDLSVLAGSPLDSLFLQSTRITDLSFLRGMPLKMLALNNCPHARGFQVLSGLTSLETLLLPETLLTLPQEDLQAIAALRGNRNLRQIEIGVAMEGMLTSTTGSADAFWKMWDRDMTCILELYRTGVKFKVGRRDDKSLYLSIEDPDFSDLGLCRGANITYLMLKGTKIRDLKAVVDMPVKLLELHDTPITDLTPLGGMPLYSLMVMIGKIRDVSVLEQAPLNTSLKELWLEDVLVGDYRPIAACKRLQLISVRNSPLENLEVLRGLPLRQMFIAESPLKDLSAIAGMPLETLFIGGTQVTDLRPLLKCPGLKSVLLSPGAVDLDPLHGLPKLERVSYDYDKKLGMPLTTVAQFWKDRPRREAQKQSAAGEFDAAEKTFIETLAAARKSSGEHSEAIIPALLELANCRAWNGRYRESAPLYREVIQIRVPGRKTTPVAMEMLDYYSLAIVQGAAGDKAGYQATCAEFIKRCEGNKDEGIAERALLYSTLVPGSGVPETTLKSLATTAAPMAKGSLAYWYHTAIGIAEYRAGHFPAATENLKKVEVFENSSASLLADITLAMIAHQTGDKADAAARLKRTRAAVANHWPLHQDRVNDVRNWQNWLAADLLVKEAAGMIEGTGGK